VGSSVLIKNFASMTWPVTPFRLVSAMDETTAPALIQAICLVPNGNG
jgi:hypothetical protein